MYNNVTVTVLIKIVQPNEMSISSTVLFAMCASVLDLIEISTTKLQSMFVVYSSISPVGIFIDFSALLQIWFMIAILHVFIVINAVT